MKIGLQPNIFLSSPIEEAVRQTLELRPDCMEIVYETPQFPPSSRESLRTYEELKEILTTSNVELSVHSSFFELNLGSMYAELRKLVLEQIEKCIKFSSNINAKMVTVHSGYFPLSDDDNALRSAARERFEYDLKTCVRIAEEHGIKLSLENMDSPKFFVHCLEEAAKLAEKIDGLGITLDIVHLHIYKSRCGIQSPEKQIAEEIVSLLENSLTHLHLSDNIGREDSHLSPRDGQINFEPIVEAIKKINYNGQIIVELWKPSNPVEAGIKALKVAREFFQG